MRMFNEKTGEFCDAGERQIPIMKDIGWRMAKSGDKELAEEVKAEAEKTVKKEKKGKKDEE